MSWVKDPKKRKCLHCCILCTLYLWHTHKEGNESMKMVLCSTIKSIDWEYVRLACFCQFFTVKGGNGCVITCLVASEQEKQKQIRLFIGRVFPF